ncbi:hypothetical protein BN174_4160003 [Clostridioides difficile E15]|nr:hypothetical protein BN174_4160003 [Clostridioides difficile E15]
MSLFLSLKLYPYLLCKKNLQINKMDNIIQINKEIHKYILREKVCIVINSKNHAIGKTGSEYKSIRSCNISYSPSKIYV